MESKISPDELVYFAKEKLALYFCGSSCVTLIHWTVVEDLYEWTEGLYVPKLAHVIDNLVNSNK